MFPSKTLLTLSLSGLALLLTACGRDEAPAAPSAALSDGVLVPSYAQWVQSNQRMAETGKAFCNDTADLDTLRDGFIVAQQAWARLQPMAVGPLGEGNLAWQVQFWPDKKNLVARQVKALLKTRPERADIENGSVVVQGLTAYEYALYDPEVDLADSAVRADFCPLIVAIGEHQQALAERVFQQWQGETGVASQMRQFPNERYADADEALSDIVRVQVSALDGLKKKLGAPLGRPGQGIAQPYQAEAWRSGRSMANIAATVQGAEQLWRGANEDGLRSLVTEQEDLVQRIDRAYARTREQLDAVQSPLAAQLADPAGLERLNALYDGLNTLHRLHQGDLAKALGVQIGFNAHDGD